MPAILSITHKFPAAAAFAASYAATVKRSASTQSSLASSRATSRSWLVIPFRAFTPSTYLVMAASTFFANASTSALNTLPSAMGKPMKMGVDGNGGIGGGCVCTPCRVCWCLVLVKCRRACACQRFHAPNNVHAHAHAHACSCMQCTQSSSSIFMFEKSMNHHNTRQPMTMRRQQPGAMSCTGSGNMHMPCAEPSTTHRPQCIPCRPPPTAAIKQRLLVPIY